LRKIGPETTELVDDVCFYVAGLVGLCNCLFVKVAEDAIGVVQASFNEERRWGVGVVDNIGDFYERLGAVFIGGSNLAEVGNEVFEELAPCCDLLVDRPVVYPRQPTLEAFCENFGRGALGRYRCVEDAVFAIITAFLVVEGHATNATGVYGLSAATASEAATPLDGTLLLESTAA
jgi:hypothetical protein